MYTPEEKVYWQFEISYMLPQEEETDDGTQGWIECVETWIKDVPAHIVDEEDVRMHIEETNTACQVLSIWDMTRLDDSHQ